MVNLTFMLCVTLIMIPFDIECITMTIEFGESNTYLPANGFLDNTATRIYQCIEMCYRCSFCKSINYLKVSRLCMLNSADANGLHPHLLTRGGTRVLSVIRSELLG